MTNTYSEKVIAELRAEMARQRLTQRRLAAKVGWSQQLLSTRLTGDVQMTVEELGKLADALGIETEQLTNPVQR